MFCKGSTVARKRYERDTLRFMVLYAVVLLCSNWFVKHDGAERFYLYFWSGIPAIPVVAIIVRMGRYLREEKDEYQRLLAMQSILVGTAALLVTVVVSDFLRAFARVRALPPFTGFLVFCAGMPRLSWSSDCGIGCQTVNNRLRELRAVHGWSQAFLAERLEVSRQSVNAIETGKYDPSLPLAFKIARLFQQPIEQIFADDEGR